MVGCLITKCSHICYWKHPIFNSVSRIFNHFRLMSSLVLPSFLYIFKNVFETKSKEWKGGVFFCYEFTFCSASTSGPIICGIHNDQNYVYCWSQFSNALFDWIYRYCAGTTPWGNPSEHHDFEPQRHDDGYIEVIGFTMTSLVCNWVWQLVFVCLSVK